MEFLKREEGTVCAQRYRERTKERADTTKDKQHPAAFPANAMMMCNPHTQQQQPTPKKSPPKIQINRFMQ